MTIEELLTGIESRRAAPRRSLGASRPSAQAAPPTSCHEAGSQPAPTQPCRYMLHRVIDDKSQLVSATEIRHPIFARLFDRLSRSMEREVGDQRRELLAHLSGRVVEIGAGNGINFAHYPDTVEEVVALEPEPYLRGRAERSALAVPVKVRVRDGLADPLPLEDRSMDAAVASLVLCTVPDQARAMPLHQLLERADETADRMSTVGHAAIR